MWRQEHTDADLQDVPGDLVTASGSGLDPNITLANAEFQLDRVAAKWADDTKHDAGDGHTIMTLKLAQRKSYRRL